MERQVFSYDLTVVNGRGEEIERPRIVPPNLESDIPLSERQVLLFEGEKESRYYQVVALVSRYERDDLDKNIAKNGRHKAYLEEKFKPAFNPKSI